MIGDVLTTTLLADALKKTYADAVIHFLIMPSAEAVVRHHPSIDKLIFYDKNNGNFLHRNLNIATKVNSEKYDVVIDVYSKWSSAFLTKYSNAATRIGQYKPYLHFFYTHTKKNLKERVYDMPLAYSNRMQLLEPLHIPIDKKLHPKIKILEQEKTNMLTICEANKLDFNRNVYIMINIFGSSPNKTYPPKYLAELLNQTAHELPNMRYLLNYFPKQAKEVEQFLKFCTKNTQQKIDLFYRSDLREFIVLTSLCKAVIGNEGGAIHIGNALSLPTLAIFSPWVSRDAWGLEAEKTPHISLHLKDFCPQLYTNVSKKALLKNYHYYYEKLTPNLIFNRVFSFLSRINNLNN